MAKKKQQGTTKKTQRAKPAQLSALEQRVAALEARMGDPVADRAPAGSWQAPDHAGRPWAVQELRDRVGPPGAVMCTGTVDLPDGEHVDGQRDRLVADLLEGGWGPMADRLSALAHPVRIELLRRVLSGTRTTAELAGLDAVGTTGQLYHHVKQLIAAGWLRQAGRGRYEVPADRVVPLLAIVTAAM
jgi:hypothetical protein